MQKYFRKGFQCADAFSNAGLIKMLNCVDKLCAKITLNDVGVGTTMMMIKSGRNKK